MAKNPYTLLSYGLGLAGGALIPTAHLLLRSTTLTALGISLLILGMVCFALGTTRPRIPPEVSTLLLETGMENLAALLEELGLKSKGIYLPSSLTSEQPQALIPLHPNPLPPQIDKAVPKRLIVQFGPNPEDMGLLITTPGSATIGMLEAKPANTSVEIEAAITSIMVGTLDLANDVAVHMNDRKVNVEISNPRLENENSWLHDCLGSPSASITASVVAEALDKPVVVEQEQHTPRKITIELGILQ